MSPRNPKYPLEPLRQHRDRGVDAATAELGDAVRARETAAIAQQSAEQARDAAAARAAAVRAAESEKLEGGVLRVVDLARAGAWEVAAEAERQDHARTLEQASTRLASANAEEADARAALATKKADRDVVAKDEARFHDRLRRARDVAEEEAADEAFAGRRRDS